MKIALITPARPQSRTGNRHTAQRYGELLRSLGHRTTIDVEWDGRHADMMIALHARRSHDSILRYRKAYPARPLVVVLTGTDLYRDIRSDRNALQSLELADRLVVLQEMGRFELAAPLRRKARVIFQSSPGRAGQAPPRGLFRVCVLGHLREEKDPFRAALALAHLRDLDGIEVLHLGEALSRDMALEARRIMRAEPRYRWLGGVAHWKALRWLARSHVLVLSSRMEGGANVISEAARARVPVIASRISGNTGMLGRDYPGYYPLGDEIALAALLRRAATSSAFYARLKRGIAVRRRLFSPACERECLRRLLLELGTQQGSSRPPSRIFRTGAKVLR